MRWQDRVARKIVSRMIANELETDPETGNAGTSTAAVVNLMSLCRVDVGKLLRSLKRIQERFEESADLPERTVEWRERLERDT